MGQINLLYIYIYIERERDLMKTEEQKSRNSEKIYKDEHTSPYNT